MRTSFVKSTLERLIRDGILKKQDSVLAIAAKTAEKNVFQDLEFSNVTISNLDTRMKGDEFAPYAWSYQNAQDLSFEPLSFDFAFVSDGLHHCDSPHRALLEMYRVARKGVIVFESRDSLLMRLANRLNLSPLYELEAVVTNDFKYGGVNNTFIPNYIYRWTEREFRNTIRSHDPTGKHVFRYFYGLNLPFQMAKLKKSRLKYNVVRFSEVGITLITRLFKKQCNSFCMLALKPKLPEDLWPWLEQREGGIVFNEDYAHTVFRTETGTEIP